MSFCCKKIEIFRQKLKKIPDKRNGLGHDEVCELVYLKTQNTNNEYIKYIKIY